MSLGRFMRSLALVVSCALVACSEDVAEPGNEDLPEEVVVRVGEKGGTVKAKGVSLVIPEGALDKDVMISAKQIDMDKVELPKGAKEAVSAVYEFGPKGTTFKKEVQVQFNTEKEQPNAKVFFTKQGDESTFEKLVSKSENKQVSAGTKHFSLGFAGIPADEVQADLDASTGNPDVGAGAPDASSGGDRLDAGIGVSDGGDTREPDASPVDDGGNGTNAKTIIVTSRDALGNLGDQTWAAYQDGDGAWTELPSTGGLYKFEISSERYGFAHVCADGTFSDGNVIYAPRSHGAFTIEQTANCVITSTTSALMTGTLTTPGDAGWLDYAHGSRRGQVSITEPGVVQNYAITNLLMGVPTDIVLALKANTSAVLRMDVLRGVVSTSSLARDIDMLSGGFVPENTIATVTNSSNATFAVEYVVSGGKDGVAIRGAVTPDGSTMSAPVAAVPTSHMAATDRYRVIAADSVQSPGNTLEVELFTQDPNALSVTLPPLFTPDVFAKTTPYFAPTMTFSDVPGATEYSLKMRYNESCYFTVTAMAGWFPSEDTHELTLPDLSGATSFEAYYVPSSHSDTTASAVYRTNDATSSLRRTSSYQEFLNLP